MEEHIPKIIGTILLAFLGGFIAYRNIRRNRVALAAHEFRNTILTELEGIYPILAHWHRRDFSRFKNTLPKIDNAAAKFRFYVFRKTAFDSAMKKYREYCETIYWESFAADKFYPSIQRVKEDKRIEFKNSHFAFHFSAFSARQNL